MSKRIVEEIDSKGNSRFYPERKLLGLWWCRYQTPRGPTDFPTFNEANDWMCYVHTVSTKVHEVGDEVRKYGMTPRGKPMTQTIEEWKHLVDLDEIAMHKMVKEISGLKPER